MEILSSEFYKLFSGRIILVPEIEEKLLVKHKVYKEDLEDALGDPYMVVVRSKRKQLNEKGKNYEIYAETENGRVLFVVGTIFPDGNLYIITSYWANEKTESFYYIESEVLRDD